MSVLSVLNKPLACGDDQGGQGVDTCLITPRPGAQVTDCIKISASHGLIKGKKSFPLEIALRGIYEYSLRSRFDGGSSEHSAENNAWKGNDLSV